MFKLRIYLLVFTLLVGSICNAASFDCKKARCQQLMTPWQKFMKKLRKPLKTLKSSEH